jgi:hypothetical protein
MAVNGADKSYAFMEFPLSMSRQDAFPLDRSSVLYSLEDAQTYAKESPLAYVGQLISVVVDGVSSIYQIKNTDGELEQLGAETQNATDGMEVSTDEEVNEMLAEIFGNKGSEVNN